MAQDDAMDVGGVTAGKGEKGKGKGKSKVKSKGWQSTRIQGRPCVREVWQDESNDR